MISKCNDELHNSGLVHSIQEREHTRTVISTQQSGAEHYAQVAGRHVVVSIRYLLQVSHQHCQTLIIVLR